MSVLEISSRAEVLVEYIEALKVWDRALVEAEMQVRTLTPLQRSNCRVEIARLAASRRDLDGRRRIVAKALLSRFRK